MRIYKIHSIGILLALCGLTGQAAAQDRALNTPAARQLFKEQNLWAASANAAGTAFDTLRNYSNLEIKYDRLFGDFRRPQTGKTVSDLNVYAEGFVNLKNAYVWGEFKFTHENTSDVQYNASVTNPYRGNPYYVVDEYASKWRNQFYHLKFRAATPVVWNRVTFGIEGTYQSSLAAKQRDPRCDTRFFNLELVPGVTYVLGRHHCVGANLIYASIKEESSMELDVAQNDQTYYELYGLGTAIKGFGGGRTTNYFGNQWGWAAQYNFNRAGWNLLAEANWTRHVENEEISFTTPRKDGLVDNRNLTLGLHLIKHANNFTHNGQIRYGYRKINGIQYLSQRDTGKEQAGWIVMHRDVRSTYRTTLLEAAYSLIRNRGNEYSWRADVSATYTYLDDEYILPQSLKNSKNMYLQLHLKKNIMIGDKYNNRLLLDVTGGWKNAMSGKYVYGGPHADYITVTAMETQDENYLLSDAWNVGGSVVYSQRVKRSASVNAYAKLTCNYQHTSSYDYNHRSYVSISTGLNF